MDLMWWGESVSEPPGRSTVMQEVVQQRVGNEAHHQNRRAHGRPRVS